MKFPYLLQKHAGRKWLPLRGFKTKIGAYIKLASLRRRFPRNTYRVKRITT